MKKTILLIGLIALIIIGGLYAKRKYYDPRQRLDNARTEVRKLVDNSELREGDLIFQTLLSVGCGKQFGQASFAWSWLEGKLQLSILKKNVKSRAFLLAAT